MRKPFPIIIFTLIHVLSKAQLEMTLTIENQSTENGDFYFDVYLYRSSGIADGDIYLGNSNFYLTFNNTNFSSPSIAKVGNSPGHCNLKPTSNSMIDQLVTSSNYYSDTEPSIFDGNKIAIQINAPTPSDQLEFDTRVAKINNSTSTHCLGRFKITGISNPYGTAGLKWITSGTSIFTLATSLQNTPPFQSVAIGNLNAINPVDASLPVELVSFSADIFEETQIKLDWVTAYELENQGFEVEKRVREDQWVKIGFVPGGQTQTGNNYFFIDENPSKGINFYRLKQMDFDGHFTHSNIVSIYFSRTEGVDVFPNPVSRLLFVEGAENSATFNIVDNNGLVVKEGILTQEPIDVSQLPSGIYILQTENNSSKFLKW
ncbi:MAG: T9SS type A sorting domain-containing protein [Saprospiraceae bacterium]|nr:T9SS type A sorting domain-containing protein [Saprospiraceae bacterium]